MAETYLRSSVKIFKCSNFCGFVNWCEFVCIFVWILPFYQKLTQMLFVRCIISHYFLPPLPELPHPLCPLVQILNCWTTTTPSVYCLQSSVLQVSTWSYKILELFQNNMWWHWTRSTLPRWGSVLHIWSSCANTGTWLLQGCQVQKSLQSQHGSIDLKTKYCWQSSGV